MAGGGRLLDHGGVLLGDLIHLVHGRVDLLQAGGLLLGRGRDFAHQTVDFGHATDDALQGLARLSDQIDALADLATRGRDQGLDLLGGFGRALGQGPDFRGDHGEAATRVARSGGFDPGVQGQKIGLEGDLVDHADDIADLGRRLLDGGHGGHGVAHDIAAGLGVAARGLHHAGGLTRAVGGLVHRGGDLVQGGGRFFQAGRLLLGATRQIVRGLRNLARTRADGGDVGDDDGHGLFQLRDGGVEVRLQLLGLGRDLGRHAVGQVAAGHGLQALGQGGNGDAVLFGGARLLSLDAGALVLGGLSLGHGLGFQTGVGDGGVLEGRHGRSHLADLILAAHGRHEDRGVACGQAAHGRGHGQQRLAQHVGQHEGHGCGDDQGQDDAADQHHPHRLGDGVLNLAIDAALLGLFFHQGFQRVLGRTDVFIRRAFATDHGDGLGVGGGISDQDAACLDHVLGPLSGGGAGGAHLILAGAVQLSDAIEALAEVLAVRGQTLQIIGVPRQQEAAIAAFLTRQIEFGRLGLALGRRGADAIHPRAFQRVHLHEHRHAHGDDGQDDDGEGRHQLLLDLQIAQHAHVTSPPGLLFNRLRARTSARPPGGRRSSRPRRGYRCHTSAHPAPACRSACASRRGSRRRIQRPRQRCDRRRRPRPWSWGQPKPSPAARPTRLPWSPRNRRAYS
ncbi:hypothetical protein D3C80_679830 [compost metagenome]